jgi:tetratricopeptide (TPR) repeat protein
LSLAVFFAQNKQLKAAIAAVDEAAKYGEPKEDVFGSLIFNCTLDGAGDVAETIAANYPDRMARSANANLFLAQARIDNGHPAEALPLLQKAASLDKESTEPYDWIAEAYLQLHRWSAAISAANNAIKIEPKDAGAYYNRARALARLGRTAEALTSLKKAIELDEDYRGVLIEEEDLKSLAALPAFKKLVAEAQKQ